MICVADCYGEDAPVFCEFCGDCSHLCAGKCPGLRRAKALDKKPTAHHIVDAPGKRGYIKSAVDGYRPILKTA